MPTAKKKVEETQTEDAGLKYLRAAEAIAGEKGLEREEVVRVMEEAIQMAVRRKYGMNKEVFVEIDRISGNLTVRFLKKVVDVVMEPINEDEIRLAIREDREPEMQPALDKKGQPVKESENQILLEEAKKSSPDIELGEFISDDLEDADFFGRVAAQSAKQVILQKIREVERGHEYTEYQNMAGEVVSGLVKRADHRGVLVDLGKAEAFLPREEMIAREMYKQGDRLRAYIYKVEEAPRGHQIWLSRTHPQFLIKLFEEQVPEVASGTIQILNAARDPGFRAKIAVKSYDHNLDPVGACVGIRGVRVQAVTSELQGERVDIINWSADPAEFLVRAMSPAEVTKVVLDEAENRIEVVVPEDKLSLAIGRRGQNVRLASMLTGFDIDVMSESEEADRRAKEYEAMTAHFIEALDVDDTLARLLIAEGFSAAEQLTQVEAEEIGRIDGLDNDIAAELQNRASTYMNAQAETLKKLGVADDLMTVPGMRAAWLEKLAGQDVKTLDDLGDLATDELLEMVADPTLSKKEAENMIMEARKHWFEDGPDEEEEVEAADAAETPAPAAEDTPAETASA